MAVFHVREWLAWSSASDPASTRERARQLRLRLLEQHRQAVDAIANKAANAHRIGSNGSVNGAAADAKPLHIRLRFVPVLL